MELQPELIDDAEEIHDPEEEKVIELASRETIVGEIVEFYKPLKLTIADGGNEFALLLIFGMDSPVQLEEKKSKFSGQLYPRSNQLILLNRGEFRLSPINEYAKIAYLLVENMVLERHLPEHHLLLNSFPDRQIWLNLQCNSSSRVSAILNELSYLDQQNTFQNILAQAKYLEILALQIATFEGHALQQPLPSDDLAKMDLVKELISKNLNKNFTIAALAKLAGTNSQYLKTNFKKAYHTTVAQYILACKMNHAKEILLTGRNTIADIAQAVGYKHATHFTHAFKKFFGQLPRTFKP